MFIQELRSAFRRLVARPGYALISLLVLSLGLGSTLFLLGALNGMFLKPVPFPHAERLVAVGYLPRTESTGIGGMSSDDYFELVPELESYEAMGGFTTATVNLSRNEGATRYQGSLITHEVLDLLGEAPVLGRAFTPADDAPGAPLTVLLSDHVWRNDFGADPAVIGRAIRANSQPATIIGVMPPKFTFPIREEVWLPRRARPGDDFGFDVIARLAPGVSMDAARAEAEAVTERMKATLDGMETGEQRLVVKPIDVRFVGEEGRKFVSLMFVTSLLVLLLACANVSNLTYTTTLARARELAVRSALGADRRRLVAALIVEMLVLCLVASGLGLVLAELGGRWVMDALVAAEDAPGYYVEFGVDARMFVYAIGAALLATLAAGLIPALRATGGGVQIALRDGDRGGGARMSRATRSLVVAEIAITCIVLVSAGTFIRALDRMVDFDFGTRADPASILTARIGLFPEDFATEAEQVRFFDRVVDAVRAEAVVASASAANALPGTASSGNAYAEAVGEAKPAHGWPRTYLAQVDRHFAETYDIRLSAGRFFDARDTADGERVAVVDARLAEQLWPGRDPLGLKLKWDPSDPESQILTVVGVVPRLHLEDVDDDRFPSVLVPIAQSPSRFMTIAVRTRADPLAFAPRLAEIVRTQNADTPIYWVRTQERAIRLGRVGPVLIAQIFSGVGALGLALAAAGLYGVLAFAVTQRTREIGIRRAIGAPQKSVLGAIGGRIVVQVALGLVIGCALAWPWTGLLLADDGVGSQREVATFLIAIATIVVASAFAALVPLRRALRVDPMIALRHE